MTSFFLGFFLSFEIVVSNPHGFGMDLSELSAWILEISANKLSQFGLVIRVCIVDFDAHLFDRIKSEAFRDFFEHLHMAVRGIKLNLRSFFLHQFFTTNENNMAL